MQANILKDKSILAVAFIKISVQGYTLQKREPELVLKVLELSGYIHQLSVASAAHVFVFSLLLLVFHRLTLVHFYTHIQSIFFPCFLVGLVGLLLCCKAASMESS